jgi:hypothetical protein
MSPGALGGKEEVKRKKEENGAQSQVSGLKIYVCLEIARRHFWESKK